MSCNSSVPTICATPPIQFNYDCERHRSLPHVVKFSGGRSSALMLMGLLYGDQLKPSRGDVIVFNNTSAEHPETYNFTALCKKIAEERFNVPFFWTEFQTYEDARRGRWARIPSYRLVQPFPYRYYANKQSKGYRRYGEVFEELISWKQALPTRFARSCTEYLKLHTTFRFLEEWFGRADTNNNQLKRSKSRRLGHWYGLSQMPPATDYQDREQVVKYVLEQDTVRQSQVFADYTKTKLERLDSTYLEEYVYDRKAELTGGRHVEFLSVIGLRADEPRRVSRVFARNNGAHSVSRMADGEYVYAPLFDAGIEKSDVFDFWNRQSWDLQIPHDRNLSNCVYCFMKGERTIRELSLLRTNCKGPSSLNWWVDIENRYARKRPSRNNPESVTTFGFFGANRLAYEKIQRTSNRQYSIESYCALPCECTD